MKRGETLLLLSTLVIYALLVIVPARIASRGHVEGVSVSSFDLSLSITSRGGPAPAAMPKEPKREEFYVRTFAWSGPDQAPRQVSLSLSKPLVQEEMRLFGVPRDMQHPLILQKKGYKRIGIDIYIVNYAQIFLRNVPLFADLTQSLLAAAQPQKPEYPLPDFLLFVQSLKFSRPPSYYRNLFINSFFPPLICLYEQYGDCDSKSVLLAVFLVCQNREEKLAMLLFRSLGFNHALLAVKRNPLPGMYALFLMNKGYYIPLETSGPGWAPGFISERIWKAIQGGSFMIEDLQ